MHSILPSKAPVVIIGAGPTGLTAANLLAQAGIETLVIERNKAPCDFPRAIAIDDEGLRVFQATGLLKEVLAHARLNVQAHYISSRHFLAKVAPQEHRNGFPLISTFHQPTLERILLKGLERFSCAKVYFHYTLQSFEQDEQSVHISVRTPSNLLSQVECAYLLACDGGKSSVRHILNIPMHPPTMRRQRSSYHSMNREQKWGFASIRGKPGRGVTWRAPVCRGEGFSGNGRTPGDAPTRFLNISPQKTESQKWLVVDGVGESEPSDTILFLCNPARPAVSVPGPGTQRRWEFMLLPGEREEELLNSNTVSQFITDALHNIPHDAYSSTTHTLSSLQLTRQIIYTFHALIAARFSQGRTFLLGDAAHLMPPFGGQGMNSGLRDAHNLCWKLQLVLQNTADTNLLASYHVERYPHVAQMILFSSFLGKVIMTTQHPIALLRDLVLRTIDKLPLIREMLTEMRIKPQPRYTDGFLLKNSMGGARKLVGAFLPQPHVLTQEGNRVLLDEVLGNSFALLRLYEDENEAFAGMSSDIWERLNVKFVCVKSSSSTRDIRDITWRHWLIQPTGSMSIRGNVGRGVTLRAPPLRASSSALSGDITLRAPPLRESSSALSGGARKVTPLPTFPAVSPERMEIRPTYIIDSEQRISNFLQHRRDVYVLVRPDRYIIGTCNVRQIRRFEEILQTSVRRLS